MNSQQLKLVAIFTATLSIIIFFVCETNYFTILILFIGITNCTSAIRYHLNRKQHKKNPPPNHTFTPQHLLLVASVLTAIIGTLGMVFNKENIVYPWVFLSSLLLLIGLRIFSNKLERK